MAAQCQARFFLLLARDALGGKLAQRDERRPRTRAAKALLNSVAPVVAERNLAVELPAGPWRVLLDSGADPYGVPGARPARLEGAALRLCGRHAVVLERTA